MLNLYKTNHPFYTPVKFSNGTYTIKIETELTQINTNKNITHAYDVLEIKKIKLGKRNSSPKNSQPDKIILADVLKNVKDYYGVNYLLQDNLFVDTEKATNKIVRGFITGDEVKFV